jgi:hypothetical protein
MNLKKHLASFLLTVLFTASVSTLMPGDNSTESATPIEASVTAKKEHGVKYFKKQYDTLGTFLGCWGEGSNCAVYAFTQDLAINFSTEGIHLQFADPK